MTEKRYLLKYSEFETSNGEIIQAEPYFIDTKEEYVDEVYFTMDGYPTMSYKQVLDLLNENEQLKQSEKDCQEWNHKLINENEQLKQKVDELYENDKILRKQLVQDGILVKTDYFREMMNLLKELGHDDLYNDLNTTSLDMSVNCR